MYGRLLNVTEIGDSSTSICLHMPPSLGVRGSRVPAKFCLTLAILNLLVYKSQASVEESLGMAETPVFQ